MKFKSIYLSAALALFLASCGAKKITAEPLAITTPLTEKKAKLSDADEKRWSHLDLLKDTVPGMSVDRVYELLKDRKSTKVVVGVIDSGVDIDHPELKPVIWTNSKEVAGNNIDDDKNGYIDDVHGWNFLGNIEHENLEYVRIVKKGDDGSETYKRAKAEYDKEIQEAQAGKQQMDFILKADASFREKTGKENYTAEDLEKLTTDDQMLTALKSRFIQILSRTSRADLMKQIAGGVEHYDNQLKYNLKQDYDPRKELLGDDPDDWNSRGYGNNNVTGPEKDGAKHGTHVAGIIAQARNNNIGGDGVATPVVEIMSVRAVPDGDEYDKDVALAIRYAVDNGAKVINGSFGKYYSPHSQWVYDALKYAGQKDVLVVFAAGNEGINLDADKSERYPNDDSNTLTEYTDNVLTIGALNEIYSTDEMVAPFSNFGKTKVDVFSPGMRIYATTPNDTYEFLQGTSMASPNAAGVAALVRAYYPKLTAQQVKQIIMKSGIAIPIEVMVGDVEQPQPFSEISRSGKIVNAYNAIILADKVSRGEKL
ncbi:S8 family peptidase [Flavobacterium sp. RHBU_24]|uniref:S8 family peptidase n=1 Tax=Flavobacterium sp. RHBU_24 TaxID=3391185 RepID=UPI003984EE84